MAGLTVAYVCLHPIWHASDAIFCLACVWGVNKGCEKNCKWVTPAVAYLWYTEGCMGWQG